MSTIANNKSESFSSTATFYLTKKSKVNELIKINLPFIVVEGEKVIPRSKPVSRAEQHRRVYAVGLELVGDPAQ